MKIRENKILKYLGVSILTAAMIHGGISIYDSSIDHTEEICPLTNILGVGHQIDAINNNQNNISNGIRASYMESELELQDYIFNEDGTATKTIEIDPIVVIDENGNKTFSAPSGFILDGDKCYKTITVDDIYAEDGTATKTIEIDPIVVIDENGNKTLSAPSGFILDGDKCYRTITVDDIYADYGMIIIERNGVTENILNIKKGK